MPETPLQEALRRQYALRVGREMADYLRRQSAQSAGPVPLIAADARTGVPVRTSLPAEALKRLAAEPQTGS